LCRPSKSVKHKNGKEGRKGKDNGDISRGDGCVFWGVGKEAKRSLPTILSHSSTEWGLQYATFAPKGPALSLMGKRVFSTRKEGGGGDM